MGVAFILQELQYKFEALSEAKEEQDHQITVISPNSWDVIIGSHAEWAAKGCPWVDKDGMVANSSGSGMHVDGGGFQK